MNHSTTSGRSSVTRLLSIAFAAGAALCGAAVQAAVPGIAGAAGTTTPVFDLAASTAYITQPDGQMIYSWGYGCNSAPARFLPFGDTVGTCPTMQLPGPTLIVNEGDTVTVKLTNGLPAAAGKTSIVFPGFNVAATGGSKGVLTNEASPSPDGGTTPGLPVTYTFIANKPGTYAYYSGTQSDLQVEMGLYGAVIVVPAPTTANGGYAPPATCAKGPSSLAATAYDHNSTCYDREYLFQFSEMNLEIHQAAEAAVAKGGTGPLNVATEPNQPEYFLINGRSMPDLMDTSYASSYAHQPYNANPHMHPGELMLMRVIGQGRYQHPFHFHGNHARVLARDGNLLTSATDITKLAGPLLFTTPTVPGQSQDQIFTWTGQGLNWDVYGLTQTHTCNGVTLAAATANVPHLGDASPTATTISLKSNNGFDSGSHEYCLDHGKSIPVLPPDPNVVANGLWYGGTPYLGLQNSNPTPLPPGAVVQNSDAGYAYMWHSHNEREITTNNVFPGGMMMMMIIDPPSSPIDEKQ